MKKAHDILIKSQLFGGLPDEDITEIEKIAVDKHFHKGDIVFYDGDDGSGFYLVAVGSVSVYKLSLMEKSRFFISSTKATPSARCPFFPANRFPPTPGLSPSAIFCFSTGKNLFSLLPANRISR